MATFQHPLWGYALTYPDGWVHQTLNDVEGFAATAEALLPGYEGPGSGHLLVHGEWNSRLEPLEPLWNQHIALTAGFLGAKRVGSAPWAMASMAGLEAEIVLPKGQNLRLWAGILGGGWHVLHFMVAHRKDERAAFEPLASEVIRSLAFVESAEGTAVDEAGLPVPPGYRAADPLAFLPDIADATGWRAYEGQSSIGALQAFYWRETAAHGWQASEYAPYPGDGQLGFARLTVVKGGQRAVIGLLPFGEGRSAGDYQARVVVRLE
jgi:hypothetical protein